KNQVVAFSEENAPTYGVFDFHSENPDWKLLAQLSGFTEASGAREKNSDNLLAGASLQWKGDDIKRVTINSNNEPVVGVAEDIIDRERIELVAASLGKTTVMSTLGVGLENKGHYEGTMEDLELVIPAFQGNPNTTYTGTITWTLQSPVITKGE
ncbi:MAG TPA: WxL domain-containing protein, partial [Erysipelothrix sp.]